MKTRYKGVISRRNFLKALSTTAVVAGQATPWLFNLSLAGSAAAQTAMDYKALVCIFLSGGNDTFNTILATDTNSWAEYKKWRDKGQSPLSLKNSNEPGGVLPIAPKTAQLGRSFAIHPNLVDLQRFFNEGRLAILSNVGPLQNSPIIYLNNKNSGTPVFPPSIYSHEDQQAIWQSQTGGGGYGWGGKMGDLLSSINGANTIFTSISTDGNHKFLTGTDTISYAASPDGGVDIRVLNSMNSFELSRANLVKRIITRRSSDLFEDEAAKVTTRSIDAYQLFLTSILPVGENGVASPTKINSLDNGELEDNPLAVQLQTVARIIGARSALGMKRQVFFVNLGVFDTHSQQNVQHNHAMLQVNHALAYFDKVLSNLKGQDLRSQVTTFTASDFGRTFTSNGSGTDHGYGAHHFILGGGVKGGDIYGEFPKLGLGHNLDLGNGILFPQHSVDQYGATLARWFGINESSLDEVFPNLKKFDSSNLGFMI
jgi:uncharacterized protein (DUF1501 family)